jgi:cytosine/adenosine deaminase-related metal-dependent hydrolase
MRSPAAVAIVLLSALFAAAAHAAEPASVDLLITRGHVLTLNDQREVIRDGVVAIRGERIVAVGDSALATRFRAKRVIDARGGLVLPGMINAHTHASMTVFRGLGDDVPDRLKRFIFPLEKHFVDREVVHWGALHGIIEMIEGGVTTFTDMYYFEEEVARAARLAGMRGVLGQTIVNFPAPDTPEPYGGIALARRFITTHRGDPLITPALAPHAPYTVEPGRLREIAKLAEELDAPVLMHVAEMTDEVAALRRDHNLTPVGHLAAAGLLNRRLVAAHCIFVDDADIALLASSGAGVAHALVANIKSAKGVAPVTRMMAAGVRVGLATDGPMSGNTLDVIGQLGYVAKVHKLDRRDRNVMPAVDVVALATRGGARALHLEDRLGSLEAGKVADVIIVDTESTAMVPLHDPYSALVYAASPRDVRTTVIHGRVVMEDRRILTVDAAAVRTRMRTLTDRINAALAKGLPP